LRDQDLSKPDSDEVGEEEDGGVSESRDRRAEEPIARRAGRDDDLPLADCDVSIRMLGGTDGAEPLRPALGMGTVEPDPEA
jgi:hypothetical protein